MEEGTVSALIAMSEGATDNSLSTFDASAMVPPRVWAVETTKYMLDETMQPSNFMSDFKPLIITTVKEAGGDAPINKGPAAPIPPPMAGQHVPHAPVVDEEEEQKNDEEDNLDKVMMFAKMTVPPELENDDNSMLEGETPMIEAFSTKVMIVEEPEKEVMAEKEVVNHNNRRPSNVRQTTGKRMTSRSGRSSPSSPPMPMRAEQTASPLTSGPKEKQAKARRRRRSLDEKKKRNTDHYKAGEGADDGSVPFDAQKNILGLY